MDYSSSLANNETNSQLMCGLSHSRSKSLYFSGARVVIAHGNKLVQSLNKNYTLQLNHFDYFLI